MRPASQPQGLQIPQHDKLLCTASGLQYAILRPGKKNGKKDDNEKRARFGDRVKVHISVWRADGTLVESSRKARGEPVVQTVGLRMVPGLAEGLTLVAEGGRIKLVVPPALAFGERGGPKAGPNSRPVPPNTTLVYDVELLQVVEGRLRLPKFTPLPATANKLESGLRYTVLKAGKGDVPAAADLLELSYTMFNVHGQLMELSERTRKRSREGWEKIGLKFWQEALAMLRPGARYRFHVPAALGYGKTGLKRGMMELVPPDTDTVWEVELLRVLTPLPVPPFAKSPLEKTVRTASGLRYEIVKPGKGKKPGPEDQVEVHYAGWLLDGKLFDSSFAQGEPATFGVQQGLIPGFAEGLQLMQEGAVLKLTIPPELGYRLEGNRDIGIGPNQTLIFHVELVRVLPPAAKDKKDK